MHTHTIKFDCSSCFESHQSSHAVGLGQWC
uniref:Uncharacterized protein n=1 Tax=Anguilla anguilla TaxID=7936 RepID=A0A0E9TTU4_ANGAN